MTLVLLEKGLVLEGSTPKIEDKQVPYIYIYIYTYIHIDFSAHVLCSDTHIHFYHLLILNGSVARHRATVVVQASGNLMVGSQCLKSGPGTPGKDEDLGCFVRWDIYIYTQYIHVTYIIYPKLYICIS